MCIFLAKAGTVYPRRHEAEMRSKGGRFSSKNHLAGRDDRISKENDRHVSTYIVLYGIRHRTKTAVPLNSIQKVTYNNCLRMVRSLTLAPFSRQRPFRLH